MNEEITWAGLGASLSTWNVGALKNLSLSVQIARHYDPLSDLATELGMIAGINIIKEIFLELKFYTGVEPSGGAAIWAPFDSLFTTPGSFPKLDFVTVKIVWTTDGWESDPDEGFVPLTKESFPKLLDSKVVGFEFSFEYLM